MPQRRLIFVVGSVTLLAASVAFGDPPAGGAPRPPHSGPPGGPPGRARGMDARPGPSGEHEHGGPPGASSAPGHRGHDHDGDGDDERGRGRDRDRDGGPPGDGERGGRRHFRGMWNDLHEGFRSGKPNKDELKKKLDEWHAARDERRKDHREHLISRWGKALHKPDVTSELRRHSERMARLARMEEIVGTEKTGAERQKLLDRIDKLRNNENERHQKAMERLSSASGAPAPSGVASAPAAAASAPAAPAPSAGGAQ